MNMNSTNLFLIFLLCAFSGQAQLVVSVLPPKITGQKAIVELKMKNSLAEKIESARAICFLFDDHGQMVGQSTKWVIGHNHTGLEPKAEATFNFVITSLQPLTTTNLTAKVSFSRVALNDKKLANPRTDVQILEASKSYNRLNRKRPTEYLLTEVR